MVSYEVSIGFVIITVLLLVGSLNLSTIVEAQREGIWRWHGFRLFDTADFPGNVLIGVTMLAMMVIFFVSALAETNRPPFDLPEAESELVAGYHTEYSAMKFSMFFMAEYIAMITASSLLVTLFLGGWQLPFPPEVLGLRPGWLLWSLEILSFVVKVGFFMVLYVWVRWTLPRFRYDQLMNLGWKRLFPLALLNVVVTGLLVAFDVI